MKKLLVISVVLNVVLAVALVVNASVSSRMNQMLHLGLESEGEFQTKMYEMSLSALESDDLAEKEQAAHFLRLLIKNWEEGAETREIVRELLK